MKKGFTLIELLAVLAILAIIATITAPIILNVIRNARIDAFENDANSLIRAANNYYAEASLDSEASVPVTITFEDKQETTTINGIVSNERVLDYTGQNPDRGELNISRTGKVSFVLYNDTVDKCAVKNQYDKTTTILDSDDEGCALTNDSCFITEDNPDGTVTITGYDTTNCELDLDLTIPLTLNGKTVYSVGRNAFNSTGLTSLTIESPSTRNRSNNLSSPIYLDDFSFANNNISYVTINNVTYDSSNFRSANIDNIHGYAFCNNPIWGECPI